MHGEARKRSSSAAKRLAQAFKEADNATTPAQAEAAMEKLYEIAKLADIDGFTPDERNRFKKKFAEMQKAMRR